MNILFCNGREFDNNIYVTHTKEHYCSLKFREKSYDCALGKNGISYNKVEGDGCTPVGAFSLRRAFYRIDRIKSFVNISNYLNTEVTEPDFGWCDDPKSEFYNDFVTLPITVSHENLWLNDSVAYDLLAVIGYNDCPVIPGLGSAIFFHVTETFGPTAGCVAVLLEDLQFILSNLDFTSMMIIK